MNAPRGTQLLFPKLPTGATALHEEGTATMTSSLYEWAPTAAMITLVAAVAWAALAQPRRARRQQLTKGPRPPFTATDENDLAHVAVVHTPAQEARMGALHPGGMLYEKPINHEASEHHASLGRALRRHGVQVHNAVEVLAERCAQHPEEMVAVAVETLTYRFEGDRAALSRDARYQLSDEYKREVLAHQSPEALAEVILTRPTVVLRASARNTELEVVDFRFNPLGNLVFTRDQQITTAKGVVLGRMNSPQRAAEVQVMGLVWRQLGVDVIGTVPEPERLEGGDFISLGHRGLSLIGTGLRTTNGAAQWLMDNDLLGTRRVGVVRDEHDRNQERMHLDTVFNVVNEHVVVLEERLMGPRTRFTRVVDEYERDDETGAYRLAREEVPFEEFLRGEGYTIVPVTPEQQQAYMINFLNVGGGHLISVNEGLEELLARAGVAAPDVHVEYIEFDGVKRMYGAAHCGTQVARLPSAQPSDPLRRRRRSEAEA